MALFLTIAFIVMFIVDILLVVACYNRPDDPPEEHAPVIVFVCLAIANLVGLASTWSNHLTLAHVTSLDGADSGNQAIAVAILVFVVVLSFTTMDDYLNHGVNPSL